MRVVLDTNVLVSAFISERGIPAEILDVVITLQETKLVLSEEILREFSEVMNREEVKSRFAYSEEQIFAFEEAIRSVAEIVKIESMVKFVEDDPADDIVVNTALDGNADYIISGDAHLLKLRKFGKVQVVSPRGFLRIVRQEFGNLILPASELNEGPRVSRVRRRSAD